MKKAMILALAMAVVFVGVALFTGTSQHPTGIAFAQVAGTLHDLSTDGKSDASMGSTKQVCVFCHHPHVGDSSYSNLLWNYNASTADIDVYNGYATNNMNGSSTINGADDRLSGGGDGASRRSWLCMSCHDGTIGGDTLIKIPGDAGTTDPTLGVVAGFAADGANLGTNLQDDHPVNITYANTVDQGLSQDMQNTIVIGKYPLYKNSGGLLTVQCATCHNVHAGRLNPSLNDSADTAIEFMRGSTVASAICTDCHIDK
jgi:hypothetical protein